MYILSRLSALIPFESSEFLSIPYFFNAGFSIVVSNFSSWQYSNKIWLSQFSRCLFLICPPFEYYFSCLENIPWRGFSSYDAFLLMIILSLICYSNKVPSSYPLLYLVLAVFVKLGKSLSPICDLFLTAAVTDSLLV